MQTKLSADLQGTAAGEEAEAILRKCVHCGFCNATCPTYQLLGDELDGPRGRIYLIKQVLEGGPVTRSTQLHLDRCLTCRNCETTCPSGVKFGNLIDIGRELVDAQVTRPVAERSARWLLKEGLTSTLFAPAVAVGRRLRGALPEMLRDKLPPPAPDRLRPPPTASHARKVLLLAGCVQPALMPNINRATQRVLDAAGIETLFAGQAGCCGSLRLHLGDVEGSREHMRRNIDAWWPFIEAGGIEAIVINASGCSVTVKEYAHALKSDPAYAAKAERVGALTRDLSELLPEIAALLAARIQGRRAGRLAYHAPCTLQHGQQLRGTVEAALTALGFDVAVAPQEAHLCCGSAGTYSVLQPELSHALRDRKLANLAPLAADCIVSGNVGCIGQLQSGTATPVRHWIEILDDALSAHAEQQD
jgi:glycolate oxidase iron-sulfur subunit